MKVSVADAKNKLPELIKAVENGETVTIMAHRRLPYRRMAQPLAGLKGANRTNQ